MRVDTGQDVGRMWLIVGVLFGAMVIVLRTLPRAPGVQTPSLWIGYVGLAAVGAALVATSAWVRRKGPRSTAARLALNSLLGLAFVLWFLALVFPFL